MNIKQLRYVVAILATGSFSAAAEREGVSVQAVSKAMSELEGKTGAPLFNRASSGVTPTPLGRAFGARAKRVLAEYDALVSFARSSAREAGVSRALRLGLCVPRFPGIERICTMISVVSGRALGCEVDVVLTTCSACIDELREGRFDALVTVGSLKERGVVTGSLGTMSPYVVMAGSNPLAKKSELTLEDINTCPVALAPEFDHFNESVCRAYAAHGMTSELVEIPTLESYGDLMEHRNGLSLIVGGEFIGPFDGCVMRPIAQKDRLAIPICLSSLEGASFSYLELSRALSKMKILS